MQKSTPPVVSEKIAPASRYRDRAYKTSPSKRFPKEFFLNIPRCISLTIHASLYIVRFIFCSRQSEENFFRPYIVSEKNLLQFERKKWLKFKEKNPLPWQQ